MRTKYVTTRALLLLTVPEFLSHIGQTDAIFHVTRAFDDADIEHVEGNVDPVRDLAIISEELRLKDLQQLARTIPALQAHLKKNAKDKLKAEELEVLQKCNDMLTAGKDVRSGDWSNKEIDILNDQYFLSAKNVVFLVNIAQTSFETQKNKCVDASVSFVSSRISSAFHTPKHLLAIES